MRGKIIGGIIGFLCGGPFGLLIGLWLGHIYDSGRMGSPLWRNQKRAEETKRIFFDATFQIMGYVAKSDGQISQKEIALAEQVMRDMGLNASMRQQAIQLFEQGKTSHFSWQPSIQQLRQACWRQPNLLRLFVDIQMQMAYVEGPHITAEKRALLQQIFHGLGIHGFLFDQFEQQFKARYNYSSHQRAHTPYNRAQRLSDSYQMLGITSDAFPAEIKKAYRKLMSQNHPDKLIAKGLPPEMIKVATQKTQQIQEAYEQIRQARGL